MICMIWSFVWSDHLHYLIIYMIWSFAWFDQLFDLIICMILSFAWFDDLHDLIICVICMIWSFVWQQSDQNVNGLTCNRVPPPGSSDCSYTGPSRRLPYLDYRYRLFFIIILFHTHPKLGYMQTLTICDANFVMYVFVCMHTHLSCPWPSQTTLLFCKVLVRWVCGTIWLNIFVFVFVFVRKPGGPKIMLQWDSVLGQQIAL